MSEIIVGGVPLLIVVFGLVEFLKKFDVQGKALTASSMAIGVVLGVLWRLSLKIPTTLEDWLGVVLWGLLLGLAACGIYDFATKRMPPWSD